MDFFVLFLGLPGRGLLLLVDGPSKSPDGCAKGPSHVRQPFGTNDEERDDEDNDQFRQADAPDHIGLSSERLETPLPTMLVIASFGKVPVTDKKPHNSWPMKNDGSHEE
jgi:hypothetical protein